MIRCLSPGLLETALVGEGHYAIRDGLMNLFLCRGPEGLVCFDAGWRPARVAAGFLRLGLQVHEVAAVFLTHLHWDHARGVSLFPDADIYVGEHETPPFYLRHICAMPRLHRLRDQEIVAAAGLTVRAIHTPGHTAGSLSYLAHGTLFAGDALRLKRGQAVPFMRCCNHDHRAHLASLRKLARLDGLACVAVAHSGLSRNPRQAFAAWANADASAGGPAA